MNSWVQIYLMRSCRFIGNDAFMLKYFYSRLEKRTHEKSLRHRRSRFQCMSRNLLRRRQLHHVILYRVLLDMDPYPSRKKPDTRSKNDGSWHVLNHNLFVFAVYESSFIVLA